MLVETLTGLQFILNKTQFLTSGSGRNSSSKFTPVALVLAFSSNETLLI